MTKVSQGKAISEGEKKIDCCTGNNTTFAFIINSSIVLAKFSGGSLPKQSLTMEKLDWDKTILSSLQKYLKSS